MSRFNLRGHPAVSLLVANLKDKLFYFPLDYKELSDVRQQKKKQKHVGRMKKYLERNELEGSWRETLPRIEGLQMSKAACQEMLRVRMNSVGIF